MIRSTCLFPTNPFNPFSTTKLEFLFSYSAFVSSLQFPCINSSVFWTSKHTTLFSASSAAASLPAFANGGIVGGNSYTGDKVLEDEKSIAYSLVFQESDRTLTEEEVTKVFEKIINDVTSKMDAKLRDKEL